MKKYTAQITKDYENVAYEIDGWGQSPQDFHKIVMIEHIDHPREEILCIFNNKDKKVFRLNKGFSGS